MNQAFPDPARARVLVVDDEETIRKAWRRMLPEQEFEVATSADAEEALDTLATWPADVAIVDLRMPGIDGLELLRRVKQRHAEIEVVIMTGYGGVDDAVTAVKQGAYDFLSKPFESVDAAVLAVRKAAERRRLLARTRQLEQALDERRPLADLVGRAAPMREVFRLVESVAPSLASVLIQGESGTGKELVARAIHSAGPRKTRAFVAVNCSALTETLLESELFGHVRGAFTGAVAAHKGLFETAHGGTLFLDEIGEVPPSTQVKLLRVLQEGEVKPVGSAESVRVDVRMLAATNADLLAAMKRGRFREDLYYRLNVVSITLPPLRDRPDDIPLLAHHFLRKYAARAGRDVTALEPEALAALACYRWPGNVRELENVLERAVVLGRGDTVRAADLPPHIAEPGPEGTTANESYAHLEFRQARRLALSQFERRYLSQILRRARGNVSEAARGAGMDRSNFKRILRRCALDPEEFK